MQYGGGYLVWGRHIISTVEGVKYDGDELRICHIISTDLSHHQYGPVASSVRTCRIISTVEDVQYRTTKTAQRGSWWLYLPGKNDIFCRQS